MRLYISSSNRIALLRWLWFYLIFLLTLCSVLYAYNHYWVKQGYKPALVDSKSLWAYQRDNVYSSKKTPLVFIGASRTLFGIDLPYIRERLPDFEPVMLAINGKYPLAALKDLALDRKFSGVLVVDIDSHGLLSVHNEMQQDYVSYYHSSWNPSWRLHRFFLNKWQESTVLGDPAISITAVIQRWFTGQKVPRQPNFTIDVDRNSGLLLTDADGEVLKKVFVKILRKDLEEKFVDDVEEWASNLEDIQLWVSLIQARGGQVIFYTPPVTGELQQLYDEVYPKERYWDVFMAQLPIKALQAQEIRGIDAIILPDGSHMNADSKGAYNKLLLDAFIKKRML